MYDIWNEIHWFNFIIIIYLIEGPCNQENLLASDTCDMNTDECYITIEENQSPEGKSQWTRVYVSAWQNCKKQIQLSHSSRNGPYLIDNVWKCQNKKDVIITKHK
jgi:hypothetical protein